MPTKFANSIQKEVRDQRKFYRKTLSKIEQAEIYELFLDLRILSVVDERIAKKERKTNIPYSQIPFFHLLRRCSPVFAAVMENTANLEPNPKAVIESSRHHRQKRWKGEFTVPGTKEHFYWVLKFPEPPVVFKDLLRVFSFHWSVFGDATRMIALEGIRFDKGTGSSDHLRFVHFFSDFLSAMLVRDLGAVLSEALSSTKLVEDPHLDLRALRARTMCEKMRGAYAEIVQGAAFDIEKGDLQNFQKLAVARDSQNRSSKVMLSSPKPAALKKSPDDFERIIRWLGL